MSSCEARDDGPGARRGPKRPVRAQAGAAPLATMGSRAPERAMRRGAEMLRQIQAIRAGLAKLCLLGLVLLASLLPRFAAAADPAQGPGGPILVVTSGTGTFSKYYAEILRTEGFNEFAMADVSTVTPALLANYDVV